MKNYRKRRWVCHQGMFILRPSVPLLKESVWVSRALRMSRTQTPDSGSWLCAPLSFQNVLYWASFCVGLNEHGFKSFFPTHWLEGRLNFSESQCPLLLKKQNKTKQNIIVRWQILLCFLFLWIQSSLRYLMPLSCFPFTRSIPRIINICHLHFLTSHLLFDPLTWLLLPSVHGSSAGQSR